LQIIPIFYFFAITKQDIVPDGGKSCYILNCWPQAPQAAPRGHTHTYNKARTRTARCEQAKAELAWSRCGTWRAPQHNSLATRLDYIKQNLKPKNTNRHCSSIHPKPVEENTALDTEALFGAGATSHPETVGTNEIINIASRLFAWAQKCA
jgi:hypothetical protein